jgi:hypothetical protein
MSTSRVSGPQGQTHSSRSRDKNKLRPHRFIGLTLGGGKNDRTSLAVLEYYPGQQKLFLTHIYEHIQQEEEISADQVLLEIINEHGADLEYLSINAPLKFPKCVRCKLACPGYERCKEKEIVWMWKQHRKNKTKKKRAKLFTPYTQRAAEMYIATELEEEFHPLEALGANIAPLTARAHFLLKRLPKVPVIETFPRLSVFRIGQSLKLNKSHLDHYKHQIGGDEHRQTFLQALLKRDIVFIYQQDFHKLIENPNSFDAFISAFTGFLKYKDQCEKTPKEFPGSDGWIDFPVRNPELF